MPIPKGAPPPKRLVLADLVYEKLLQAIVDGRFEPGEALVDTEIASWVGASKAPVREALDRLAAIDLVRILHGSGTFVAPLDAQYVHDVLETVWPVHVECTRLLVPLITDHERRGMLRRVQSVQEHGGTAMFAADGLVEFTFGAIGSDRIVQFWHELQPHLLRMWGAEPATEPTALDAEQVVAFTEAVYARDGDGAAAVLERWYEARDVDVPRAAVSEQKRSSTALLREQAFATLLAAIGDGTLAPGDELPEDELVTWLDMTRQPIRAALHRLASYNLVTLVPGRPAIVAAVDPLKTGRTLMLSGILNSFAITRAHGTLTAAQRVEVADATAAMEAARARHDMQTMPVAVERFFNAFIHATGNPVLTRELERLGFELTQREWPGVSPEYAKRIADRITRIDRAVQGGDEVDFPAAVRHLYDYVYDDFLSTYTQR